MMLTQSWIIFHLNRMRSAIIALSPVSSAGGIAV
jgi:hypothetical protein